MFVVLLSTFLGYLSCWLLVQVFALWISDAERIAFLLSVVLVLACRKPISCREPTSVLSLHVDCYGDVHGSATRLVVRQKLSLDVATKSFLELAGIILTVFA